ncbi:MAG: lysoplasmalogenase family protein [Lachnospiraceae bacterium]|nr:lysoplasmalogenase family protein [Lachnospiraceae bacterium]
MTDKSAGSSLFLFPLLAALFLILMAVFCTLFLRNLIDREKRVHVKTTYLKISTSACFVAIAFLGTLSRQAIEPFCLFLLAGSFSGLVGDLLLGLRYADGERKNSYTRGGFIAFLLGHLFYIFYMLLRFDRVLTSPVTGRILFVSVILGLVIGHADRLMGLDYGSFSSMISSYSMVIIASTFLGMAASIRQKFQNPAANLFAIGAVLFLLSDLILSGTYFGKGKDRPVDLILNHIFYFGGQFLIALALFF